MLSLATSGALTEAWRLWAPPIRRRPSEWLEAEYALAPEESATPGRYSFARHEFLREIADSLSDPDIEMVVLGKAAQTGWTTVLTGLICQVAASDPSRILMVMPTESEGEIWSKDRFEPNARATRATRSLLRPVKSRDANNTILHKRFPGGSIKIVGANSPVGLASWPAKYTLLDEVDRYPLSAGDEGDPIALVRKRAQTWLRRGGKLLMGSTPGNEGESTVWHYYAQGDQRKWMVPCHECGERQELRFAPAEDRRGGVVWSDGEPGRACYVCERCGCCWTDLERLANVRLGVWQATAVGDPKIRSYHVGGLLSPDVTHAELARKWLAAETDEQRKAVVNTDIGLPWRVRGDAPEWQRLYERREDLDPAVVPMPVEMVTAGVDVQKDRIEARVWGWAKDKQSWLLDVRIMLGDTSRGEVWGELDGLLAEVWRREDGTVLPIERMAVDTGYATNQVYEWAKRHNRRTVMLVKGQPRGPAILTPPTAVQVRRQNGKIAKAGVRVWGVYGDALKSQFYGWLRLDAPLDGEEHPPGYVHVPRWVSDDEIKQMTAEHQVVDKVKGGFRRLVWALQAGRRNEGLDCRVYAHAAAIEAGLDRLGDRPRLARERHKPPPEPVKAAEEHIRLPVAAPPSAPADEGDGFRRSSPARRGWLGRRGVE